MVKSQDITTEEIWNLLSEIPDPEVPAISIVDLGVIRNVDYKENTVNISITPTYSGCPALNAMEEDIKNRLGRAGIENVHFKLVYKPAWTTDWISDKAKQKLKDYGIAPPETLEEFERTAGRKPVVCPFCDSDKTALTSFFGSTACKSLHYCNNCNQPFEHFKCH